MLRVEGLCLGQPRVAGEPTARYGDEWLTAYVRERSLAMTMDRKIRMIAGTVVLVSLALGWWVSPYWLLFTAFVGANLLQSSLTKSSAGVTTEPTASRVHRLSGTGCVRGSACRGLVLGPA